MGNGKAWYAVVLATIFTNPIIFAVLAIIFVVIFAILYATLLFYGLVSALIYGGVGFLLIFLAGKNNIERHWQIIFIVPVFFVFGWFSDRMGSLGLSILPSRISQNVVLTSNAWVNGSETTIVGNIFVAIAALIIAVLALGFVSYLRKK